MTEHQFIILKTAKYSKKDQILILPYLYEMESLGMQILDEGKISL